MANRPKPSFNCPNCGAYVRGNAKSCPECGSDDETGWSEEAEYSGLDLPTDDEDDFDDEFAEKRPGGFWRIVAAVVLVLVVLLVALRLM